MVPKMVGNELVKNKVLDYLQFSNNMVGGSIFNVPDMCVVGGTILFLVAFIIYTIIGMVVNLEKNVNKNKPINLFIDTTQKHLNICLFQGIEINIRKSIPTNNNLTDVAIEHIRKLLKYAKVQPNQIDNIYITIGPGSFTGDRIGSIIVKV
jgi:predicted transglutaminase-like protease